MKLAEYISSHKYMLLAVLALLLCVGFTSCNYNSLVEKEQAVEQAWAQVQNKYQYRADLIPNLVNTVKGYAAHEASTLEKVTEARAKATSINLNIDDLTEENLAKYQAAQNDLSSALKSLLAVTEAYPDLKANENFKDLQMQLERTESQISLERYRYTQAVQAYNTAIKKFPTNIYASWFGFKPRPQFQANPGAESAPTVEF